MIGVQTSRCQCLFGKKKRDDVLSQNLITDFEYFQCSDYYPKDLQRFKKLLFGENCLRIVNSPQNTMNQKREDNEEEEDHNYLSDVSI